LLALSPDSAAARLHPGYGVLQRIHADVSDERDSGFGLQEAAGRPGMTSREMNSKRVMASFSRAPCARATRSGVHGDVKAVSFAMLPVIPTRTFRSVPRYFR